jgi:spore coat polysaccharide biosynthesis protein SpsF (cytidylyltransferase family)
VHAQMLKNDLHDLFSITGLPLGMNLSGYTVSYLEKCLNEHRGKKMETGWGRVFKEPKTWAHSLGNYDIMGDLRFTLDYKEDADFFCSVINSLKERIINISDPDLISFVEQNNLQKINSFKKEEYWKNYNSEKQKELDEQK